MNVIAPAILLIALIAFALLLRCEPCPVRRRCWRQAVAISGLLLIGAVARTVALGARAGDSGFDWPVHIAKK
jgi:hypothetical protein